MWSFTLSSILCTSWVNRSSADRVKCRLHSRPFRHYPFFGLRLWVPSCRALSSLRRLSNVTPRTNYPSPQPSSPSVISEDRCVMAVGISRGGDQCGRGRTAGGRNQMVRCDQISHFLSSASFYIFLTYSPTSGLLLLFVSRIDLGF